MSSDIQTVERLATQMYSSPDRDLRQAADAELRANAMENGDLLMGVLRASSDKYGLMFAALAMVHWFRKARETLTLAQQEAVIAATHGASQRLFNAAAPRYLLLIPVGCQSRVTKLSFEKEPTAIRLVVNSTLAMIQAQNSPDEVGFALISLNALVQEMCLFDSSKANSFLTFAAHRRCSNNFRDACMQEIFAASLEQLARIDGPGHPNVLETTTLVKLALTYDFMAILVDETEEGLSAQFPASWKELLLNGRTIDLIWAAHDNLPMPHCLTMLQAIGALCGMRRSFFDTPDERDAFLGHLLGCIARVGRSTDGRLQDSNYCTALADACLRFVSPYGYKDLSGTANFQEWLAFLRDFTIALFSVPFGEAASFNTSTSLLRLWTRLSNSKRLHIGGENPVWDIEEAMPQCALAFFQTRVAPGQPTSDVDFNDVAETLQTQADLFNSLCTLESTKILEEFTQFLNNVAPQLCQPHEVVQLSWALFLTGSLLRGQFGSLEEADLPSRSAFLGTAVALADSARQLHTALPPESSMFLEGALLYFLTQLQLTFASPRITGNLVKILTSVFGTKAKMFQFFLGCVGHNLLRELTSGGCDEIALVKHSIDLIHEICRDMPADIMGELNLSLPPVVSLSLSQHQETYKLRTNLHTALWSVRLYNYTLGRFLEFMAPIDGLIQATMAGAEQSPLFIAGWLRDLRGVCKAASASQATFADFVEWIIERSNAFLTLSRNANPPLVTVALLRFVTEVVTPHSGYGRVNIAAASHSATGVLLFKFIAEVIQNVLTTSINNEMIARVEGATGAVDGAYEFMLKPIFLCMEAMRKCINGDFVPFGAMTFYRDPIYDDTVVGMCRLLTVFPLYLFSQYNKVTLSAMDMLRSMVENSVFSPLAVMPQNDLFTLIEFAIAIAKETDTKTSTLLYALTLLGFIAGLIKPTKELLEQRARGGSPALSPSAPHQSPSLGSPHQAPASGGLGGQSATSAMLRSSRHVREKIAEKLVDSPDLWNRLIEAAMNVVTCQDRALSASTAVVFPIFEADPFFWRVFSNNFVASYPTEKQQQVAELVANLGNASETQDKFFSEIFVFRAAIRKL